MFKKKLPQVVHTKITLKKRALGKKICTPIRKQFNI